MTDAGFSNIYDDEIRANAYAKLECPGTYYLAYRDLPAIISKHVQGRKALDFGCGAGRSTRFLRQLGFDVVGVDIAQPMLARARECDPQGDYRLIPDGNLSSLSPETYDIVLCAFTFDNIPTMEKKVAIFRSLKPVGGIRALSALTTMEKKVAIFRFLKRLLKGGGRIVNLVSAPEVYVNEWVSFSTKDFPENRMARSGDKVRVTMLDVEDRRPVEDILWTDEDYNEVYRRAELVPIATYRPLAKQSEPYSWVSETTIAPWVIYVLGHRE